MPDALALHFATADLHEAGGDVTAAKAVYEKLAAPLEAEGPPATPDVKDGKDKPAAAAQVCNWCSGGREVTLVAAACTHSRAHLAAHLLRPP